MADISTTKVFVSGETDCDYDDFNAIVGGATINATFVSGKTGVTPDGAADYVLGWDATDSALKKFLVNNLTNIASQTAMGAIPANDDYALVYDTDVGALRKVVMTNLVAVDDSGIERDGTTRQLKLKDAGVTAAKLAAAVAGDGLVGGAGTALSVNVDDSSLVIDTDVVMVKDGGITAAMLKQDLIGDMTGATVAATDLIPFGDADASNNVKTDSVLDVVAAGITARRFSVGSLAVASSATRIEQAHGFNPSTPTNVRVVMVCETADLSFAPGDELPVEFVLANGTALPAAIQYHWNDTNVVIVQPYGGTHSYAIFTNATPPLTHSNIDKAKWSLKIYAEL